MRNNPRTSASRAPDPRITATASPAETVGLWAPTLAEPVAIKPLNGKIGTVEGIHQRVSAAPQFQVSYVNGVGSYIEDWFRADQLAPVA